MISTQRHLEFATGYLDLGMVTAAAEELEAIVGSDRLSDEVMGVRANLHLEAKQWDLLLAVARELTRRCPANEQGWVHAAYALRELGRIAEAKAVLLEAAPLHGRRCAVLHYNLACYYCLLGECTEAKRELSLACQMNAEWRRAALDDDDLKAMWTEIAAMG